ncbi:hypothetical protein ABZ614_41075 [Streptomyces sp. NPDC013178]|uniref:hypothetical protein n=1 Tax=unclassified Streptomyces TaxID=2593676 RepID=UPI0033D7D3E6
MTTPGNASVLFLHNPADIDRAFTLSVHWAGLPHGTRLFVVFEEDESGQGPRPGVGGSTYIVRPTPHQVGEDGCIREADETDKRA